MMIRLEGALITDVSYTHETEGSFNVTKILRSLDQPWVEKVIFPFNASIIESNMQADVHPETVNKMTPERGDHPVVLMGCEDGTAFVVDGNNRMRWRILRGLKFARAHFIPFEHREQFRVRLMIERDGVWREVDPKEELESMKGKHHSASSI